MESSLAKIEAITVDLQMLQEKLSDAEKEQKESSDEHSKLKASYNVVAAKVSALPPSLPSFLQARLLRSFTVLTPLS